MMLKIFLLGAVVFFAGCMHGVMVPHMGNGKMHTMQKSGKIIERSYVSDDLRIELIIPPLHEGISSTVNLSIETMNADTTGSTVIQLTAYTIENTGPDSARIKSVQFNSDGSYPVNIKPDAKGTIYFLVEKVNGNERYSLVDAVQDVAGEEQQQSFYNNSNYLYMGGIAMTAVMVIMMYGGHSIW